MSTAAATEIVNNTSTSSGSSAMATPIANSSSTGTPTSSAPPTSVSIPTARFAYLSNEEFNQWDEYRTYFYDYKDDKSLGTMRKRAEIMEELTEEQKRTFPIMSEEALTMFALEDALFVKESLKGLVRELRLEAEKVIDLRRERC